MLVLSSTPAGLASLDAVFALLFQSCTVIGYGIAGDVARLAASYPDCRAFGIVSHAVELQEVAATVLGRDTSAGGKDSSVL
jgi:hypothetical protein